MKIEGRFIAPKLLKIFQNIWTFFKVYKYYTYFIWITKMLEFQKYFFSWYFVNKWSIFIIFRQTLNKIYKLQIHSKIMNYWMSQTETWYIFYHDSYIRKKFFCNVQVIKIWLRTRYTSINMLQNRFNNSSFVFIEKHIEVN